MHAARTDPRLVITRTVLVELEMPPFARALNRVGVSFDGENAADR